MAQLADEEGDPSALTEADRALNEGEQVLAKMEFQRMLGGAHDKANCFVEINAGAGGTESQDWASMLLRMLTRYAESKGFEVEIANLMSGEEAGIKSATIRVAGEYAFGFMKAENGVHRLVRISPFDAQKRRHTSFSSVAVLPEIDDTIHIDLNEGDVLMQVFRASGAGGQHVNRTNSAVRLIHKPSGIVAECQAERSQHKNRDTAMQMLRSRLYEVELAKKTEERDQLYAGKAKIDFGSQIRSYVLQPYQMVKDLRTGHETSDTGGVLDGDLEPFIEAFLLMHAGVGAEGE
jgi:peptide chain release factor 2